MMATPNEILGTAYVLGVPTRFDMLLFLDEPLPIGELAKRVNVSLSTASYHVRYLEAVGLVVVHRRGRCHVVRRVRKRWFAIWRAFGSG